MIFNNLLKTFFGYFLLSKNIISIIAPDMVDAAYFIAHHEKGMPWKSATVPAAVIPANFYDNTLATAPFRRNGKAS